MWVKLIISLELRIIYIIICTIIIFISTSSAFLITKDMVSAVALVPPVGRMAARTLVVHTRSTLVRRQRRVLDTVSFVDCASACASTRAS